MHLTFDLVAGTANYVGLDADKESEKHYRPFADELKDTLVLMNAGYFDIEYCKGINQFKGFLFYASG
ncbi:hypothetical protein [Thorsellia kenyensis]|uniref:Transposase n=1 Tax=Thorsellia kenyensis TaxID=1549888 RepID=A0ABV6C7H0_9GAMM